MGKTVKRDPKSPRRRVTLLASRPGSSGDKGIGNGGSNIKVIVRVRPPNSKEQGDNSRIVVKIMDGRLLIFDPKEDNQPFFYHGVKQRNRDLLKKANKDMQFLFDKVFGYDSTNEDIFEASTRSLITSLMDGYNCSVFVYGATGAGKTHTMLGHNDNPGITFLTMRELFRRRDELKEEREFELGITYLEVYNEMVQDLLNPGAPLQLREDCRYGVTVAGIQIKCVNNVEELYQLLIDGNMNRTQHPTDANAESSRSHAVFQVYVRMRIFATAEVRIAKLSMIDLAGSERGASTGYSGARFTEGANINKSLLALGNCINSLADGQRHIPYRDSKLTRLLKDSLGGNCQTVMIANVSPSSLSYEDTYNTLKYATRAKKIKSNIKRNVVKCEADVGQYVKIIEELTRKKELLEKELEAEKQKNECKAETERTGQYNGCFCGAGAGDEKSGEKLRELFAVKARILEQINHLESSERILSKKRQLKEEINSRLSGLCVNSPDIQQGHRRLEGAMDRLHRQEDCFKKEIANLQVDIIRLDNEIAEIIEKAPYLKQTCDLESALVSKQEHVYKNEYLEKLVKLLENELQMNGVRQEKMLGVLQPCFLQLKGHGLAPDSLINNYQELVKEFQGIRSISWDDEVSDSGMSSTSSLPVKEKPAVGNKRKFNGETVPFYPTIDLNDTFTFSGLPTNSSKSTKTVCAEHLMTKVFKAPRLKKQDKFKSLSSPCVINNKENRNTGAKRAVGTMGTAQRFPSSALEGKIVRAKKPLQTIAKSPMPVKRLKM